MVAIVSGWVELGGDEGDLSIPITRLRMMPGHSPYHLYHGFPLSSRTAKIVWFAAWKWAVAVFIFFTYHVAIPLSFKCYY